MSLAVGFPDGPAIAAVRWERPWPVPARWSSAGVQSDDARWVGWLGPAARSAIDQARGRLLSDVRR